MAAPYWKRIGAGGRAREASRAVPHRPMRATVAILMMVVYFAGCLRYVPMDFETIPLGADVAVDITEPRDPALTDLVGPGAERVVGTLLRRSDTDLVLSVASVHYMDIAMPVQWPEREAVALPRHLLDAIEERQVDRTRSWVAAGLATLGIALVSAAITLEGGGTEGGSGKPDTGNGEVQ